MGNFIEITIVLLLLVALIVFLRSPGEIITNFLKFLWRMVPLLPWLVNQIRVDQGHRKEGHEIQKLVKEGVGNLIPIDLKQAETYVIVFGNYADDATQVLQKSLKRFNLAMNFSHWGNDQHCIIQFNDLEKLSLLMRATGLLSKAYGIENTFAFLTSPSISFFCCLSRDEPDYLIGRTAEELPIFYSLSHHKEQGDHLMAGWKGEIKAGLNTQFFEALIYKQDERPDQ